MEHEKWRRSTAVLGLKEDVSFSEIQAAYRRLVLRYHPDVTHMKGTSERFRKIVEAYGTIVDRLRKTEVRAGENLRKICSDPKVKRMSLDEFGNRLRYSSSPRVRSAAAFAAGKLFGKSGRCILIEALKDTDEGVRLVACESLAAVGLIRDIFCFLPLLRNKDSRIRKAVFRSVWRILKRKCMSFRFLTLRSDYETLSNEEV